MSYPIPPEATPPWTTGDATRSAEPSAPGPPTVDMTSSREMRAWLEQLHQQNYKLGLQNRALGIALIFGAIATLLVFWTLYHSTIGAYAVLDKLKAEQHPASPGRIHVSFQVTRPGQVFYRRESAGCGTEMIDCFHTVGAMDRPWSWPYTPGEDLVVTVWYRSWFLRRRRVWRFPTTQRLDVVMLIDTSQSMGRSIQDLKTQCTRFSERVLEEGWEPRYAVIAFGPRNIEPWLYCRGPTDDVLEFIVAVDQMPRFPESPTHGSALDALEEALSLPFEADSTRRFFLVTNRGCREENVRDTRGTQIAERLARKHVRLDVFSLPEWQSDYEALLGTAGHFHPLDQFGQWVSQGRIVED